MTYEIAQKDGQIYAIGTFTDVAGVEVYFEHPITGEGNAPEEVAEMIERYNIVVARFAEQNS